MTSSSTRNYDDTLNNSFEVGSPWAILAKSISAAGLRRPSAACAHRPAVTRAEFEDFRSLTASRFLVKGINVQAFVTYTTQIHGWSMKLMKGNHKSGMAWGLAALLRPKRILCSKRSSRKKFICLIKLTTVWSRAKWLVKNKEIKVARKHPMI